MNTLLFRKDRRALLGRVVAAFILTALFGASPILASEETIEKAPTPIKSVDKIQIETLPVSYALVNGDEDMFRAHNWRSNSYQGGIEKFSMRGENEGLIYRMDGRAILDDEDFEAVALIKKENLGYVEFDFDQFRKYYETTGGVYHPFTSLNSPKLEGWLDRDLFLDLGKLGIEVGLTPEDLPHIAFRYEREYVDGAKSRLTWGEAMERNITKNIVPSWQEIDSRVDIFEIKEEYEYKGFEFEGEQRFESLNTDLRRWEVDLSTTTTAADKAIHIQDQTPEAFVFSNTTKLAKWFNNDRALVSGGHHYVHISNSELENIRELDESMAPRSFSANAHNRFNNLAENDLGQNSMVLNGMVIPFKNTQIITRLKGEVIEREGNSVYNDEITDPPDSSINRSQYSDNYNEIQKIGESIALRFKGIPRTSLYTEAELEQVHDDLNEDRESVRGQSTPSNGDTFERATVTQSNRGVWATGVSIWPWSFFNLGSQFRLKRNNNDFDHHRETIAGSTAFFDMINVRTAEYTLRTAIKPCRYAQGSFRYVLQATDYFTRINGDDRVRTEGNINNLVFDITLTPIPTLMIVGSYTISRNEVTNALARSEPAIPTPTFRSDVDTLMLDFTFFPDERLSFNSNVYYSFADNYDDYVLSVPLGASFDRSGIGAGVKFKVNEKTNVDLGYDYQNYAPDARFSAADYSAHLIAARTSITFE